MKLLIYDWESYLQYDLDWICKEKSIQVKKFAWKFHNKNKDEKFEQWFNREVDVTEYDALLSVNYWPLLSKIANEKGIKYIAWCYDNPLNVVNIEETLGNPCNYVFFFDRIQASRYIDAGFETVYYAPLCVNANRLKKLQITNADYLKYGSQISLVGSLYESKIQEIKALLDDYSKGFIDALLNAQQNLYGCYLFDEAIDTQFIENANRYIRQKYGDTQFELLKEALTFAMASEVTRKERLILLSLLGKRFDTRLYSFQSSEVLQEVKCYPPVDYVNEMPKVFVASKINLNPSLRCIQSGIPLRALDVCGAGGFLLSNYQPELAEYFVKDEEIVMYESIEDAFEKAAFYLQHEELRKQIAQNGRERIFEAFSMSNRLEEIFETTNII